MIEKGSLVHGQLGIMDMEYYKIHQMIASFHKEVFVPLCIHVTVRKSVCKCTEPPRHLPIKLASASNQKTWGKKCTFPSHAMTMKWW